MSTEQPKALMLADRLEKDHLHTITLDMEAAAALAEHEAEKAQAAAPFGWMIEGAYYIWWGEFAEIDAKNEARRVGGTCRAFPIYLGEAPAAPASASEASVAVQLTDEELRNALRQCPQDVVENLRVRWLYATDFARAIERTLAARWGIKLEGGQG